MKRPSLCHPNANFSGGGLVPGGVGGEPSRRVSLIYVAETETSPSGVAGVYVRVGWATATPSPGPAVSPVDLYLEETLVLRFCFLIAFLSLYLRLWSSVRTPPDLATPCTVAIFIRRERGKEPPKDFDSFKSVRRCAD